MVSRKFTKDEKIRKSIEYKQVSKMGCKYHTSHFVILVKNSGFNFPRLGLTVSKKVGNAVHRNKIKRQLREYFRNNKIVFCNFDYVFVVKKTLNNNWFNELNNMIINKNISNVK